MMEKVGVAFYVSILVYNALDDSSPQAKTQLFTYTKKVISSIARECGATSEQGIFASLLGDSEPQSNGAQSSM